VGCRCASLHKVPRTANTPASSGPISAPASANTPVPRDRQHPSHQWTGSANTPHPSVQWCTCFCQHSSAEHQSVPANGPTTKPPADQSGSPHAAPSGSHPEPVHWCTAICTGRGSPAPVARSTAQGSRRCTARVGCPRAGSSVAAPTRHTHSSSPHRRQPHCYRAGA
jgi:hypothetical protein